MRALAFTVIPGLLLAGCSKPVPGAAASNYSIDRQHVKDSHGNFRGPPSETSDYWSKPFLVMLWSSDCPTCGDQLANLDAYAATGRIPVVVIDIDPLNNPDALGPLAASRGYKAVHVVRSKSDPVPVAQSDIDSNLFQAREPGTVYLHDSKLQQQWAMTGVADFKSEAVQKLLTEAK